jgi:hypothetical protein
MTSKYVIFKHRSDGSFEWIEAVEDVLTANGRLKLVSAERPGDYHLGFFNPQVRQPSCKVCVVLID